MKGNNVLKEDRVASTIHIINSLMRGLTHQKQAKKADTDYFVFAGNTIDTVINMIQNRAAKDAVVVDDLGLQIVDRLYQEGLKNITLILTRIPKEHLAFVSGLIKRTFPNIKIDIKHIEEIDYMKTDLLISNPAYGAIGANITDTLRQKIDYKEFINLLPANDYKRNKTKDLFKYQSDMMPISNGFTDAAVTTHVARIHKGTVDDPAPNINMTLDEFERSQYIDRNLDKYFEENSKRQPTVIDKYLPSRDLVKQIGPERSLIFTKRDVNHKHLPYSKKVNSYKWNVESSITADYLINNTAVDFNNAVSIEMLICATSLEKINQANFYYSEDGFKFISKLFTAVNVDSRIDLTKILPQVDWTHSWTVEEILKDYGYTDEDIAKVMADLDNFKGMDD